MIFITVGAQLPFDRFIRAVDHIAPTLEGKEIVAQVFGMKYKPRHIRTLDYINPSDFKNYVRESELIISHAGTGTILSASEMQKPLIVFPRMGRLRETRNDHQMATCRMLEKTCGLQVAYNEAELAGKIQDYLDNKLPVMEPISPYAPQELINSIRDFISPRTLFRVV
ncbi:MAG: glycosyl transferase family 28 [Chitinophagaceae bacterium]|nr:MAG: glycosyl transferase family 28 [Chitinophagaceae bacterium]